MGVVRNFDSISLALEKIELGIHRHVDGKIVSIAKDKSIGFKCGKGGYLGYSVHRKGIKHRVLIHRVIFALHHGIDELMKHETIDHINGDKYDNRIENLQGMSVLENNAKFSDSNKLGSRSLKPHQVTEIRELLALKSTLKHISSLYNVSATTIAYIRDGKTYKEFV